MHILSISIQDWIDVKGEREDNRDSAGTPVNLIAESGELLKSYIDFPSQACRAESKSSY